MDSLVELFQGWLEHAWAAQLSPPNGPKGAIRTWNVGTSSAKEAKRTKGTLLNTILVLRENLQSIPKRHLWRRQTYTLVVGLSRFVDVLRLFLDLPSHHPKFGEIFIMLQGFGTQLMCGLDISQHPLQLYWLHEHLHIFHMENTHDWLILKQLPYNCLSCWH